MGVVLSPLHSWLQFPVSGNTIPTPAAHYKLTTENYQMRAQLLYAVYVPTFILAFCQGMLALLLPVYVIGLGLSYSLIGLVLAGYGIGTLIGDLPAGVIQDRIGNRLSMTIGICIMGLGMLA